MRKGGNYKGRRHIKFLEDKKPFKNKEKSKGKDIVCNECRKPDHIKLDCPLVKKKKCKFKKKKWALKAEMRSNTECKSSDDDKANLCLVANFESEEEKDIDT